MGSVVQEVREDGPGIMLLNVLLFSLAFLLSGTEAKSTEITQEELIILTKPNEKIELKNSFRCGLFYLDPKEPPPEGKPAGALLIFNRTFDATEECKTGGDYERYNQFCRSIKEAMRKWKGKLRLASPSLSKKRAAEGSTIGGDICRHLKRKVNAPFVGKNSKKFPDGAEFGMYSNACGDPGWTYCDQKHPEKVCCNKGNYEDCESETQLG